MKMMWLMLLAFIVLLSSFALADLLRFGGGNRVTDINVVEILEYDPPQFAENITIRANVTDTYDNVIYVNFTLVGPSGATYINNQNGTPFGDYWNSTAFIINETGTWTYNVTSKDNNTINTTSIATYSNTFDITDTLFYVPSSITETIPTSYNLSYNIKLYTDTRESINYTINFTTIPRLNIGINRSVIDINSTQYSVFKLEINSTPSTLPGEYAFNITINRSNPTVRNWSIPVSITISSAYGDVEFVSPTDYTYTSCGGLIGHSERVINNGNYELTNCIPILYDGQGQTVVTGDSFSVDVGATETARVDYNYGGGAVETWMGVTCTASPDGSSDKTNNDPKVTFNPQTDCSGSGGGGGGPSTVPRIEELEGELEEAQRKAEEQGYCGDGFCDEGEDPYNCPKDCIPEVLNLEKIFCTPLFNCGNWLTAWFTNLVILIVVGNMMFFTVRSRKVGRLN